MIRTYTHGSLNKEVRFVAGYYLLEEEKTLQYKGQEVLYVIGHAVIDNSCCGVGGCRYALVPGYLVEWKKNTDKNGDPVSNVEIISDKASKAELAATIQKNEPVTQVEFW